ILDRENHGINCKAVNRARNLLDREEQTVRDEPGGDLFTPANPFETSVGHFWGVVSTHNYMRARYALIEAILKIKTFDAATSAAEHMRDMLRLCRSDHLRVRDMLPALYLRLCRDQDAYDFMKRYSTTGFSGEYDCGDTDIPYLDVVDADVFESPRYLCGNRANLAYLVCAALLKIRLLLDLVALSNSGCLAPKLPRELLDRVKLFIPSTIPVRKNREIMSRTDYSDMITELSGQVDELYVAIAKINKYFWPALLSPGAQLTARPEIQSRGTKDGMQLMLRYCYDSWIETPGSIGIIKTMSAKRTNGVGQEANSG
ncbi:MAG: hypothetical protein L6R38_009249, partial [Xanthoria sp. 2 TBL-2021]